jgi:predicted Rossmann fold flavoprotein
MRHYDVIIAGGGAAGFFTAINLAEINPALRIAILERGKSVLEKVRISGGGRCNVTHACYVPNELAKFYPRGEKELRGPFHQFAAGDTVTWFESHGVGLKTEGDGRMFPVSDSSQTIIDCFIEAARKLKIDVLTGQSVQSVFKSGRWKIDTQHDSFACEKLVIATGSNPKIWTLLERIGHTIVPPVASLFTFNIKDARIAGLPGISAEASVKIDGTSLEASGPLLITHWGMSGPAILRLSAWGARELAERDYRFSITVNWTKDFFADGIAEILREAKQIHARKSALKKSPFDQSMEFAGFSLPNRLWESLATASGISEEIRWADLSRTQIQQLAGQLTSGKFNVDGKSTFKEEFVTAGGVNLKEIDFRTMRSKIDPDLFFAGEVLDIDAITGGFNFHNAWTGGFIAARSI